MTDIAPPNAPDSAMRAVLANRLPANALAAQFEHNLAVVVGINRYRHVRPLKTARPDAERLAALLQDQLRDRHDRYQVKAFYDEQASCEALRELLMTTLPVQVQKAGERTRVLFYFAGHGDAEDGDDGLQGFLFPQDAQSDDKATLLPMAWVQDALAGLPCQHVLIILDCCSAGALPRQANTRSALLSPPLYWDSLQRYVGGKARQVITSAAHNQQALDVVASHKLGLRDTGQTHSPFAQALFEALDPASSDGQLRPAGRHGVVTATDLYQYLSDALYRRVGDMQTPGLWTTSAHEQGNFIFLLPGTRLELGPAPDLTRPENVPWPRELTGAPDQAGLFAGRDQEIRELARLTAEHPLVAVSGPSAVGKSALVRAGLLPWIKEEAERHPDQARWQTLEPLTVATQSPIQTLVSHLGQIMKVPESAEGDPAALGEVWARAQPEQRLLLVLDLDDALFEPSKQDELARLGDWLSKAAQQDRLHFVLTLRCPYGFAAAGAAGEERQPLLPTAKHFELELMDRDRLRQVVEQPAAARMMFLSDGLPNTLAKAVEGEPAALPLLTETLRRMYLRYAKDARDGQRRDRTLTRADYEAVAKDGGVTAELAESLYAERPEEEWSPVLPWVLLRLVDIEEGDYVRHRAFWEEFDYPDRRFTDKARAVIDSLTARGLAVQGADAGGRGYVELGHIALVKAWPRYDKWLRAHDDEWVLQRALEDRVERWLPNRDKAELWTDHPKLRQVEEVLWPTGEQAQGMRKRLRRVRHVLRPKIDAIDSTGWLSCAELDFIRASVNARAADWWRTVSAVLMVGILLIGLIAAARFQWSQAGRQAAAGEAVFEITVDNDDRALLLALSASYRHSAAQVGRPMVARALRSALDRTPIRDAIPGLMAYDRPIALSPNGDQVVIGHEDGNTYLLDLVSNSTPQVQQGAKAAMCLNDGGEDLVSISTPRVLRGHGSAVRSVAWSPDGSQVATVGEDGAVQLWNAADGAWLDEPPRDPSSAVRALAWSPEGGRLAMGDMNGLMQVWDVNRRKTVWQEKEHQREIWSIAWSPDGRQIATGSNDNTAVVWQADSGAKLQVLAGHIADITAIAWSPGGARILTSSGNGTAMVWDSASGERLHTLKGHTGALWSATWCPDGQQVTTWSRDGTVRVWRLAGSESMQALRGHAGPVWSVAWSPDDQWLVTGSDDGTAQVWDPISGQSVQTLAGNSGPVWSVAWSPDGKQVVTGSHDGTARIWELDSEKLPRVLSGHTELIRSVAWSPDGRHIVTGSNDGTARVWEAAMGDEMPVLDHVLDHVLDGKAGPVRSVAWFPDGGLVLTGDAAGQALVWDWQNKEIRQTLHGPGMDVVASVAWSPDGRRAMTGSWNGAARMWDVKNSALIYDLPTAQAGSVESAAWSPDGKQVVTGHADGVARLWDADRGEILQEFYHTLDVRSVAWSHDGQRIATANRDGTAQVWIVPTGLLYASLVERVCNVLTDSDIRREITAWDGCAAESARVADDLAAYKSLAGE